MGEWSVEVKYNAAPASRHRRGREVDDPAASIGSMTVCAVGRLGSTTMSIVAKADTEESARDAGLRCAGRLARRLRLPKRPGHVRVEPLAVARARWAKENGDAFGMGRDQVGDQPEPTDRPEHSRSSLGPARRAPVGVAGRRQGHPQRPRP
jgi:hypothetical protein